MPAKNPAGRGLTRFPRREHHLRAHRGRGIASISHLRSIIGEYRKRGFRTAIDDFGAGFTGLNLLIDLHPDLIKLDRHTIHGVDGDPRRRALVRGVTTICGDLGIAEIAEGVETAGDLRALKDLGITLFQGYFLGSPTLGFLKDGDAIAARMGDAISV
jgi:EAL domain-containing protein (putative c-di-GMP-specific phosphodiesterase class I)